MLRPYESVAAELAEIPRCFIEPDGSFVWVDEADVTLKLSGQVTDNGRTVMYVEVRGRGRRSMLEAIFTALGWPEQELMVQILPEAFLVESAVFLEAVSGENGPA